MKEPMRDWCFDHNTYLYRQYYFAEKNRILQRFKKQKGKGMQRVVWMRDYNNGYSTTKFAPHCKLILSCPGFFSCPATLRPMNTVPASISDIYAVTEATSTACSWITQKHCYQTTVYSVTHLWNHAPEHRHCRWLISQDPDPISSRHGWFKNQSG